MEEFIEEEYDIGQSDNKSGKGMGWYVVHTYSGYENKVKTNIEKAIENRPELRETILEVKVVGPGSKPVPLTEDEMKALSFEGPEKIRIDVAEGDTVDVIAGVWVGTVGVVKRVDANKQVVTINVELFGRETPVEISFADIKKI